MRGFILVYDVRLEYMITEIDVPGQPVSQYDAKACAQCGGEVVFAAEFCIACACSQIESRVEGQ